MDANERSKLLEECRLAFALLSTGDGVATAINGKDIELGSVVQEAMPRFVAETFASFPSMLSPAEWMAVGMRFERARQVVAQGQRMMAENKARAEKNGWELEGYKGVTIERKGPTN